MNERNTAVAKRDAHPQPAVANAPASALSPLVMHELIPRMELARRLPRSPVLFAQRLREEVLIDPGPMVYHKPGRDENGKPIELIGPSVRMAEIAARLFGNLDVSEPAIHETDSRVTATVRVLDLESNYCVPGTSAVSLVASSGRRMPPHVVANLVLAAVAKARRNAIEQVVGKHVLKEMVATCLEAETKKAEAESKKVGKDKLWNTWVGTFGKLGISETELLRACKVSSLADVGPEHFTRLKGMQNLIKQEGVPARIALGLDDEQPAAPTSGDDDFFDGGDGDGDDLMD